MLNREAIDRLVELGKPELLEVDGRQYSTRQIHRVTPAAPAALSFTSLTGLITYLTVDLDKLARPFAVHVEAFNQVSVISGHIAPDFARHAFAAAKAPEIRFPFGKFLSHESFMIALQSQFEATAQRADILKLVGTITADEVRTLKDDGVTQEATAKAGVHLADRVQIPNPVRLKPYRTFREVEQPYSDFVLRVQKSRDGLEVALFEADGGAWMLDAMKAVEGWLLDKVPEGCPVLA